MILVLNCGSQSIKWKLFDDKLKCQKEGKREVFDSKNYQKTLEEELRSLVKYKNQIDKIGHRVVFGGEKYRKPTKINENVLQELQKLSGVASLHNPYNLLGIKTAFTIFFKAEQIAVFDTEFYSNFLPKVFTYPLPKDISAKYKFKKFGFHGISHEYVAKEAAKKIKKSFNKEPYGESARGRQIKIITCHLGGGSSITAIKNGKAVDTSMGFSPMDGLVMMTRSGSIDPEIILELSNDFGSEKAEEILNNHSGLRGICGAKNMLEVLNMIKNGDKKAEGHEPSRRAKLALDIFVYSIKKYIGSYFAILGGCDALVFTGAIGFGSAKIRNMVCKDLNILSKTKILAIETNEELAIAQKIINF